MRTELSYYNLTVTSAVQPNPESDGAELSSLVSMLEHIQERVVDVADRWQAIERDDVSGDLYDVERSLRSAQRRVNRAARRLDS